MNDDQFVQLLDSINRKDEQPRLFTQLVDVISKALVGLSTVAIIGVATQISSLNVQMVKMSTNQEHIFREVDKANALLKAPRFIDEDFKRGIAPIVADNININKDLDKLRSHMSQIDIKINELMREVLISRYAQDKKSDSE